MQRNCKTNSDARGQELSKKDSVFYKGSLTIKVLVNIMKILTLFSEGRSELQTEIDKATKREQVVQLVQNQLNSLEKVYVKELSITQARLLFFLLEILRQSINTLLAVNETKVVDPQPQQIVNQTGITSPKSLILRLLQGIVCTGILGVLFSLTSTEPAAWMGILLISLLVGLEVAFELDKDNYKNIPGSFQIGEAPQMLLQIDSKILLDNLADALNTIDLAVASVIEEKPLDSSGIENQPELLLFLQRLMGASFLEKPQMTLELAQLLPQILMEQGIRAQIYRADDNSHREYFDFEPSIDRSKQDYTTITPALLNGDRLLRRGRVIEPAKLISSS